MISIGVLIGGAMAAVFFRSPFQRLLEFVRRVQDQQPAALILGLYLFFLALSSMILFDVSINTSSLKVHIKAINVMPFGYRTLWVSSI
jgi:hypothetical protein